MLTTLRIGHCWAGTFACRAHRERRLRWPLTHEWRLSRLLSYTMRCTFDTRHISISDHLDLQSLVGDRQYHRPWVRCAVIDRSLQSRVCMRNPSLSETGFRTQRLGSPDWVTLQYDIQQHFCAGGGRAWHGHPPDSCKNVFPWRLPSRECNPDGQRQSWSGAMQSLCPDDACSEGAAH